MLNFHAIKKRLVHMLRALGFRRDWYLIPLAAVIGSLAGVVAMGFGWLVRNSEIFFYEKLVDGDIRTEHLWVMVAFPTVGGLTVGLIKWASGQSLISHGIPDVMESIARKQGRMKLRNGFFAAINPAITIGTGGSAGQEGPIIHIGSVLGSVIGQTLGVSREHMSTLVGCGAAGGLAAIFNAPIAGVLLVLEVMLRDFSLKTFMPVVVSTVFSVAVFQSLAGSNEALFNMSHEMQSYQFQFGELVPYLLLGIGMSVAGCVFTKLLFSTESMTQKWRIASWAKPAIGGLVLGLMGLAFILLFPYPVGQYSPPAFFANGYPVVEALLNPATYGDMGHITFEFLIVMAIAKLVGTSLTLGSGGSGGIFAPSLFMGAALGGAFGVLVQATGIYTGLSPATYALAGMAGMLSGLAHCPLTAFILVFEITRDYKIILPVMLVAITATVVSQLLLRDSVYTLALREMGLKVGLLSEASVLRRMVVEQVPLEPAVVVYPGDAVESLLSLAERHNTDDFVVCDSEGKYIGMVTYEDLRVALLQREAVPLLIVAELMRSDPPAVELDETLDLVLDKFADCDVHSLPVLDVDHDGRLMGMITQSRLMRYYQQALNQPT